DRAPSSQSLGRDNERIDQCMGQPVNGASTTYGTLLRDLYVSLPDAMLKLGGLSLIFPMFLPSVSFHSEVTILPP
ncbi:hypothetical protein, partial [Maricaulis sp.]|uniref:hypothetical protein n=1 Tax=Maricaulis sp. TaxID=1486257 RepID=UPI0025BF82B7